MLFIVVVVSGWPGAECSVWVWRVQGKLSGGVACDHTHTSTSHCCQSNTGTKVCDKSIPDPMWYVQFHVSIQREVRFFCGGILH